MTGDRPTAERIPKERLRRIDAVTDAALAHLGVEDLLVELLDRVRDLLEADTAAVLLLDQSSQYLVATAARGIEEEIQQGVRIPLGKGFAGRIAAEKQPVILDRVDHANVLNPLLRERGICSLLGVPLVAEGQVIGVLHVGTLTERRFTEVDQNLLQLVGDRIALATRARMGQQERAAATALQRSLLPALLPQVPEIEFAARYVPGDGGGVGGDWYDVFELPSSRLCVVVGDVVGKGLSAAVTMGRLRSALRVCALHSHGPAEVLGELDRQMQHFEPGLMATALCAIFEPPYDSVSLSSAGHPPPVAARPGRDGEIVEIPADLPLGVDPARPRRTSTTSLPPGHGLLLYTDGLIERRGVSLDVGLDRLSRTVRPGEADAVCATVMSELVGSDVPVDDIAVLMMYRHDRESTDPLELLFPAAPSSLARIRAMVRPWCAAVGANAQETGDILVAVEEAASNAVEHAYGPTDGLVSVHLALEPPAVVGAVRDHGHWREPRGLNRGRGTMLMRGLTDAVEIEHLDPGTRVTFHKNLAGGVR